jgi:hypothetical protein
MIMPGGGIPSKMADRGRLDGMQPNTFVNLLFRQCIRGFFEGDATSEASKGLRQNFGFMT